MKKLQLCYDAYGDCWQWRYHFIDKWIDCGPEFDTQEQAEKWLEDSETDIADKASSIKYIF